MVPRVAPTMPVGLSLRYQGGTSLEFLGLCLCIHAERSQSLESFQHLCLVPVYGDQHHSLNIVQQEVPHLRTGVGKGYTGNPFSWQKWVEVIHLPWYRYLGDTLCGSEMQLATASGSPSQTRAPFHEPSVQPEESWVVVVYLDVGLFEESQLWWPMIGMSMTEELWSLCCINVQNMSSPETWYS